MTAPGASRGSQPCRWQASVNTRSMLSDSDHDRIAGRIPGWLPQAAHPMLPASTWAAGSRSRTAACPGGPRSRRQADLGVLAGLKVGDARDKLIDHRPAARPNLSAAVLFWTWPGNPGDAFVLTG